MYAFPRTRTNGRVGGLPGGSGGRMSARKEKILEDLPSIEAIVPTVPDAPEWLGRRLWVLAVLTWGVGDWLTTFLGMASGRSTEGNRIVAEVIAGYGHLGHLGWKVLTIGLAFGIYRQLGIGDTWALVREATRYLERIEVNDWLRLALPLALILAGLLLTLSNLVVIVARADALV